MRRFAVWHAWSAVLGAAFQPITKATGPGAGANLPREPRIAPERLFLMKALEVVVGINLHRCRSVSPGERSCLRDAHTDSALAQRLRIDEFDVAHRRDARRQFSGLRPHQPDDRKGRIAVVNGK